MQDDERTSLGDSGRVGRNDLPLPDSGPPSEAIDAPFPSPAGPLRDLGDQPDSPEVERRDELARRTGVGMPSPAGRDEPDVLPNIEAPDHPM